MTIIVLGSTVFSCCNHGLPFAVSLFSGLFLFFFNSALLTDWPEVLSLNLLCAVSPLQIYAAVYDYLWDVSPRDKQRNAVY